MRRYEDAYFTVEAAMVMPTVLCMIFLIIYMLFFQYNRCLLELDLGILALRGCVMQAENNEDRVEQLRKQMCERNEEMYIGWQCSDIKIRIEKGVLRMEQQATSEIPIALDFPSANATYENHILSPVSFLRYYHKLVGG